MVSIYERKIEKKIHKILRKHAYAKKHKIHQQTSLASDLLIDSLGYIALLAEIEREFNVEVKEEDLIYKCGDNDDIVAKDIVGLVIEGLKKG